MLKLPTLYAVITPRGTVAFDPSGDPMVFTKPWVAIKAAQADEHVLAFTMTPQPRFETAPRSPYVDA